MTKITVVYTKTCPYCPATKQLWKSIQKEMKFEYEEVDAVSPKGQQLVVKFNIMAVPTTIIDDGRDVIVGVPSKQKAIEAVSK